METLVDLPEIEYLDGIGFPKVSPQLIHFLVQGALAEVLRRAGRGRGFAGTELRCRVGAVDGTTTELVPDVAFITRERLAALAEGEWKEPPFAPDVAIEVRSPSDRPGLRAAKVERYLATGAQLVLDVDPERREITAYAAGSILTYRAGESFAHDVLTWLRFDVDEIFADVDELDSLR